MRLIVVRHGETEWNRNRRAQGRSDVALNDIGRQQARHTAERLARMRLDGVYASPLSRAYETGKIIADCCNIPIETADALAEMDMGKWEGLTFPEIKDAYPEHEAVWATRPDHSHLPGSAESTLDTMERVQRWAENLYTQSSEGAYVVVTHTWPAKLLVMGALHVELRYIHSLRLDNASISIVERNEVGWVLRLANDISHLRRDDRWRKSPL